jgi:hypothetical protein
VKTFAEQLPEPESKTPVSVVELDEQSPKGMLRDGISFKKKQKLWI